MNSEHCNKGFPILSSNSIRTYIRRKMSAAPVFEKTALQPLNNNKVAPKYLIKQEKLKQDIYAEH